MEMRFDMNHIGNYMVANSRLIRNKETLTKSEQEKSGLIKQIGEKCVPKQMVPVLKREMKEEGSQTEDISKSKRKCIEKQSPSGISVSRPRPTPSLDEVIASLSQTTDLSNLVGMLTQDAANAIGGCTRLILRTIIENAKRTASQENRKRVIPSDVDLGISTAQISYDLTCPLLKPTPSTDRMYWGRKSTKPRNIIDATSQEIVSHERFCDSIMIKDHWLVVEGIQPCVPENVIPSEVKQKFREQQEETQRVYGYGVPGIKREPMPEKRMSTQNFSIIQEHQVLYTEVTKIFTNGSSLERQKVLETIESDTGLQFLAGRFVILIAEGVRLHIGTRNTRGLANLMKLTWSLMKNSTIRLEKYLYVLVPALISCVVSKSLVPLVDPSRIGHQSKTTVPLTGTPELTEKDHERIIRDLEFEFKLREAAGKLLAELSSQYQNQNLSVRIIQTLRKVLSGNKDPSAIYGVLCTFFAFGNLTINSVVLPKMHDIFCSLQASRADVPIVKTTMTRFRKLIVETESQRMDVVLNRTIELILKIIFENEIFNDRKMADRDAYVALYAEFGALFYDYALNTEMVNENTGHLKINRPSLLLKPEVYKLELEKTKK
uniref:TAF6_C domain-containing protein n=1 Tax=Caenorhabditis tropicalis TaxID=1561998 RepID=A0A1I7UH75_9PELO